MGNAPSTPVRRAGFTLVELLMALAIVTLLAAALAFAYYASATSYVENRQMADALSNTRRTLMHMADVLRTAKTIAAEGESGLRITTAEDEQRLYQWQASENDATPDLTCTLLDSDQTVTLASNVGAMGFEVETAVDPVTEETYVAMVTISMTVREGDNPLTVSRSVVPRQRAGI